jgi:ribosomal protein L37E
MTADDRPSITCPDCGMRSFHPDDIKWGYCGSCHAFTQEGTVHKVNTPREKEN